MTEKEMIEEMAKLDIEAEKGIVAIVNQIIDETRKETAKEFADIVYKALTDKQVWNAKHNWWLQNGECFELKHLLKQILKQHYGLEVEL